MNRLLAIVALILSSAAHAQAGDRPFKFVAGLGLTGGGDKVASVTYTDGTTQTLKGGGLVMFFAGGEFRLGTLVTLQTTIGYHVDGSYASNGDLEFTRTPIDVIAYMPMTDNLRLGIGAHFIDSATLKGTGPAGYIDQKFDASVGLVVEGEYRFASWFGLKVRGVSQKYTETVTRTRFSGNHIGVLGAFYF